MSVHERFQDLFRIVVSSAALLAIGTIAPVRAAGVTVTNYGHSALLIRGGGQSVMVNPFRAVGCAQGLVKYIFFYRTGEHGDPHTVWHTKLGYVYSRDKTTINDHLP